MRERQSPGPGYRPQFALLVAALAILSACRPPADPDTTEPPPPIAAGGVTGNELAVEQVIRRGNGTEPETLDPHRAEGVTSANILRDLFEGLVAEAADGSLIPGAAESWTISDDGKAYRFRLRADGRWSNGDPVTAGDFVYSLRRSADPATLSEYSAILYPIENAAEVIRGDLPPDRLGVTALDDRTLEVRLRAPTPYLLGLLTHSSTYPVHRLTVEKYGEQFTRPGNLVSNGAYQLAEWVVQSHVKLVRNHFYWNDAHTTINEAWYIPVENAEAELNRYRAGELDMTETLPNRQIPWLRRNMPRELHIAPYLGSYVFGFNVTQPPFRASRDLRVALSMAIDRDILTSRITGAGEIPAYGWVPPLAGYAPQSPPWRGWTQAERNAEARRLYASAGYSRQNPLRVELLYNTDSNHRRLCAAVAAMWREVLGVETELTNQEWQVFLSTRREKIDTQVFRYGWIGDYADPNTFAEILHTGFGLNDMGYSSPRYDDLLDRAAREADPVRRMALLEEAERVMLDDMPIIPLYFYVSKQMVKPWVGGFESNIMDHHQTNHMYILKH